VGLLQATSLPFIVAATTIGLQVHAIGPANAAALVAAGLFSVILFPVISLQLLRSSAKGPDMVPEQAHAPLADMPADQRARGGHTTQRRGQSAS
jgi:hypothetical protein